MIRPIGQYIQYRVHLLNYATNKKTFNSIHFNMKLSFYSNNWQITTKCKKKNEEKTN